MSEISILLLVSVAKETGLSLALSNTPKTGFVASRFNYNYCLKTGVIFLIMFVKPLSFTPWGSRNIDQRTLQLSFNN